MPGRTRPKPLLATPGKFSFFTSEQAAEIDAVASQIIPTDDTPGAHEARCVYFIDRALTSFLRESQPIYTEGLKELQEKTKELFPGCRQIFGADPGTADSGAHGH